MPFNATQIDQIGHYAINLYAKNDPVDQVFDVLRQAAGAGFGGDEHVVQLALEPVLMLVVLTLLSPGLGDWLHGSAALPWLVAAIIWASFSILTLASRSSSEKAACSRTRPSASRVWILTTNPDFFSLQMR